MGKRYKNTYQICLPFIVLIGMWILSLVLDFYTAIVYLPESRFNYIEMPLFIDNSFIAWFYPKPNRFSFYFIAAIITVILELKFAKKHPD